MGYSDVHTPSLPRRITSSLVQTRLQLHVQLEGASALEGNTASTRVSHMQLVVYRMHPVISRINVSGSNSRPQRANNAALNSHAQRPDSAAPGYDFVPLGDILQTVVWPTTDVWQTAAQATQHLESDDLARLWISRISAQPPSVVQYPEVCKNGDVTVWRIRDFDPDMGLPGDARGLLSPQHSQPGSLDTLIPTDTLKEKFSVSETSRRLHLIFVFRHSNPAGEDHVEEHFWNAMDTAASLSVSLEGDTIETISLYVQRGQGADIYHLLLMTSQWSFIWSLDP
jgi:hypothetical protein